jgi:hypothetical protein
MNMIRKLTAGAFLLLLLQFLIANPAAAQQAGAMRYNGTTNKMEFYDGTGWYNFGLGLPVGSCSTPGTMDYDPLLTILGSYRFCNGTSWIQIIGLTTLTPCAQKATIEVSGDKLQVCNGLFWVNIKGSAA